MSWVADYLCAAVNDANVILEDSFLFRSKSGASVQHRQTNTNTTYMQPFLARYNRQDHEAVLRPAIVAGNYGGALQRTQRSCQRRERPQRK